jgi:hypothetical protein
VSTPSQQPKGEHQRETFQDFKREWQTIKQDFREGVGLFKEEFTSFFSFKGDNLLKVYIVFVLIILPILLSKFLGPYFLQD